MHRNEADGMTAGGPMGTAANEDFSPGTDRLAHLTPVPRAGWDPYEVWRTRVKGSPAVMQEHERDPRGRAGLSSQGAPRQLARSADPTASGSGHLL